MLGRTTTLPATLVLCGIVVAAACSPAPSPSTGPISPSPSPSTIPSATTVDVSVAVDGLDSPVDVTNARRRQRPAVRGRAGRADPHRRATGRSSTAPFLDITDRISARRRARPARARVPPGLPDRPALLRRLHRPRRRHASSSQFHVERRRARTSPTRQRDRLLLPSTQPFANHNGGARRVRARRRCCTSRLGDGGSGGDPQGNGQRLDTLLGKILRIDVDARPARPRLRGPARQPVRGDGGRRARDLAHRPAQPVAVRFDRADRRPLDRRCRAGRVGGDRRRPGGHDGQNYGWNRMEGFHCYKPSDGCDQTGLTLPVAEYGHDLGLRGRRRGRRP